MRIRVKKLHPEAKIPHFAHPGDAGMDLYSVAELILKPGERASVPTGIAIALSDGYVALVWDKSGVSHKFGVKVLGGVIDAGYRGEWLIGLVNLGQEPYPIKKGQKIAQVLIQAVERPEIEEVEELDETSRGAGRFGSTGVH
ncbi:MAG: dUTP diphosphatase [Candidatus Moraniibacteriota bacterium]|nr:MAG: dUTP diphosphatase [Candidatus Moranbacteria bacterium]